MASAYENRVPAWFWIVAGLALLWEAMGCYTYVGEVTMTAEQLAALPADQRELMANTPGWTMGVFAVAVWSGLLGAIALLLRRTWARPLFVISLIAALIQFGWWLLIARAAEKLGPSAYGVPAVIIIIAALLVWFSAMAAKRGWLR